MTAMHDHGADPAGFEGAHAPAVLPGLPAAIAEYVAPVLLARGIGVGRVEVPLKTVSELLI